MPTVTSNVIAAIALAGVPARGTTIALACFALSLMYLAGSFLNDAFDRDFDREHRPSRPIPAGEVHAGVVFDTGFAMLAGGIAVVAIAGLGLGAGWKPMIAMIALASLIIFYDANHKDTRFAPLVMTMCRLCVYVTAALLVRRDLCDQVVLGGGLLAAPFLLAPPTGRMVAAISLLDAAACAYAGRPELVVACGAAFAVTLGLRLALPRD